MTNVFKIKEIQLGLIILLSFYIISFISNLDLYMVLTHTIILDATSFIIVILMLNLGVIIRIPRVGKLVLLGKNDDWFVNAYKTIYFILFFSVFTLISSLINYAVYVDRSQNVFTLGMFIANIYYLLIALWTSYNFVLMAAEEEKLNFKEKDIWED